MMQFQILFRKLREIVLFGKETSDVNCRIHTMFLVQVAKHLSHTFGNKAPEVAKLASITGSRWPVVGKRLVEQFPYIEAEIQYAVKEYACTIVDILARRTRLAFLNAEAAADAIPKIADIMAKELKWSKTKKEVIKMFCFKIGTH